jgi:hypothetical protein
MTFCVGCTGGNDDPEVNPNPQGEVPAAATEQQQQEPAETVDDIIARLKADWKPEGQLDEFKLYESQEYNDMTLFLSVGESGLQEAFVMTTADDYGPLDQMHMAQTVAGLINEGLPASQFTDWFDNTQEMIRRGRAYWHGGDGDRFKGYCFTQEYAPELPELKMIGVYLYPKDEQQLRPYSSLPQLGLDTSKLLQANQEASPQ